MIAQPITAPSSALNVQGDRATETMGHGFFPGDPAQPALSLSHQDPVFNKASSCSRLERLYEVVAQPLDISSRDTVLALGVEALAGWAYLATRHSALNALERLPFTEHGIRPHRAGDNTQHPLNLIVHEGPLEHSGLSEACIDKLIGVDVLQYAGACGSFFSDLKRLLRPRGKFAVASFFLTEAQPQKVLARLSSGSRDDIPFPVIGPTLDRIKSLGFNRIGYVSLPQRLWNHPSTLAETPGQRRWAQAIDHAWGQGVLDYYVVHAER